jgi:DNA-binding transcriptional LysR family regulator
LRHLDLNQLLTFKTIADCKSLTLAAQRLHKTQAAISIQLKKLEELTGKKLIDRGYHSAELTPDGELLLQYARKLLMLSDEALDALNPEDISGTVRFGIPDDYASAFLLEAMQRFVKRFPKVNLLIRNDISQNLFAALKDDKLDLALVTLRSSDIHGEILRRDPLIWVAEEHYTPDPDRPIPLVLYPHGCCFRKNILDGLSEAQRDYYIAFECTGVTGVKIAIDSGLAIAATCAPLIQKNWKIIDHKSFGLPELDAVVIELRTGNSHLSKAQKHFADELRKQVLSV